MIPAAILAVALPGAAWPQTASPSPAPKSIEVTIQEVALPRDELTSLVQRAGRDNAALAAAVLRANPEQVMYVRQCVVDGDTFELTAAVSQPARRVAPNLMGTPRDATDNSYQLSLQPGGAIEAVIHGTRGSGNGAAVGPIRISGGKMTLRNGVTTLLYYSQTYASHLPGVVLNDAAVALITATVAAAPS